MKASVEVQGLDKAIKKLDKVAGMGPAKAALKAAGVHIKGKIAKYPPSSAANKPKDRGTWYERGWGTRHASGGGRKTSETLGRKWTVQQKRGLETHVGNNVSYGPYVQAEEWQASFHKRRKWKTIETVAEEEKDEVLEFVQKAIDKALEGKR
jgi:hypothetical protein